jgi:hypothetical protein
LTSVLGRLSLRVIEVHRNSDDSMAKSRNMESPLQETQTLLAQVRDLRRCCHHFPLHQRDATITQVGVCCKVRFSADRKCRSPSSLHYAHTPFATNLDALCDQASWLPHGFAPTRKASRSLCPSIVSRVSVLSSRLVSIRLLVLVSLILLVSFALSSNSRVLQDFLAFPSALAVSCPLVDLRRRP